MHKSKFSDNDSDFLTTTPAARELDVAPQTVVLWEKLGKLRATKTATGIRLFRRADVEKLKRERQAQGGAK